jgi:hypothetical protein
MDWNSHLFWFDIVLLLLPVTFECPQSGERSYKTENRGSRNACRNSKAGDLRVAGFGSVCRELWSLLLAP